MARVLSLYFQALPPKFREKRGLTQLLKWAYRYSPVIALDQAPLPLYKSDPRFCGLHLDVSGSQLLFRGEAGLAKKMHRELTQLGITAQHCIAPSLGAAWALSRYSSSPSLIVESAILPQSLAPLPLAALRLAPASIAALHELGIQRIEHLLKIPLPALRSRFSQDVILRLQQALGVIEEPLQAITFSPTLSVFRSLAGDSGGAVTESAIVQHHAQELLYELLAQCRQTHRSIAEIAIELHFATAPMLSKGCSLTIPSDDPQHLWQLLQQQLSTSPVELGVQALRLYCPSTESINAYARSFLPHSRETDAVEPPDRDFAKLIDSFTQLLGSNAVRQLERQESHIPERSFRYRPLQGSSTAPASAISAQRLVQSFRPSLLFPQPQPILAMAVLPDTPPFWIRWNGARHTIRNSIGPERICPEWWAGHDQQWATRDYFRVQLPDGLWLWIFRHPERNEWFLHGIWT